MMFGESNVLRETEFSERVRRGYLLERKGKVIHSM